MRGTERAIGIVLRWGGIALMAAMLLLYALNMAFYTGSTIGQDYLWRLEHGRLNINRMPQRNPENFYVDFSHGGPKFSPEFRNLGSSSWAVAMPIWVPLMLVTGITARAWQLRRRAIQRGRHCPTCRYDMAGLTSQTCPECGTKRVVTE